MKSLTAGLATCFLSTGLLFAGTITSPTSGVVNSGGTGGGSVTDTINQNGLSANFTCGVTDFDTFIALNSLTQWVSLPSGSAMSR